MPTLSEIIAGDFHIGAYRQKAGTVAFPGNVTVAGGLDTSGSTTSSDQPFELVTGAKTLDEGDGGVVQRVTATATITLPAVAVGRSYTVECGTPGITITLAPNAADKFMGAGLTSADDKDLVCANANLGDMVRFVGNADGWNVVEMRGTWVREA